MDGQDGAGAGVLRRRSLTPRKLGDQSYGAGQQYGQQANTHLSLVDSAAAGTSARSMLGCDSEIKSTGQLERGAQSARRPALLRVLI
jgi:hypothetical protein